MRTYLPLILLAELVACGDGDKPAADGSVGPMIDANPNAPDADPSTPDANLGADAAVPQCTSTPVAGIPTLATETVASGFESPVAAVVPPGETRLFVVSKPGLVHIVVNGAPKEPAFLDIQNVVNDGEDERGLLGIAFHPGYATNGRFYVYYTAANGALTLAEYTRTNADDANEASADPLLSIAHPLGNHNGGWLSFGPDGKLYMATGDGGGGGDGPGNAKNPNVLLGKMLRLDVDTAGTYSIPDGNPFKGMTDKKEEIWSLGLRNPWRNSFDRMTGDLYIGDVGQDFMEEINVEPAGTPGGRDYGWDVMEGTTCFNEGNFDVPKATCATAGKINPVHEYVHCSNPNDPAPCTGQGASIVGGYVYRGCRMPDLRGTYFYGDTNDGYVKSFRWDGANAVTNATNYPQFDSVIPYAFAEDQEGELLVLDGPLGIVRRFVPAP